VDEVSSNMLDVGVQLDDRVWKLELLSLETNVTSLQVHDDPNDAEGLAKIDDMVRRLASSLPPPLLGVRHGGPPPNVVIHDGRHRYNAYLRAGHKSVPVWVAPMP
jgi:hypothetical protein